ncbi:MAG: hypothetical protein ISS25_01800 [Nanoarchaeota archaeon]|nr:hypothetical protein [DPANN group archaeon]MBL7116540.1 hypothetical protein [Nanoarchaeota archaeon]
MAIDYAQGLFLIVNTLLSFYIVVYAFIFLTRTKNYPDRKPWELLFAGAFFFLISEVLGVSLFYGDAAVLGIKVSMIRVVLEFVYVSLVLMAFITQSHMILLSDMILITKKLQRRRAEEAEKEKKKKPKTKGQKIFEKLREKVTPVEELKFEIGEKELQEKMKEEHFESEIKSEKELVGEDKQ